MRHRQRRVLPVGEASDESYQRGSREAMKEWGRARSRAAELTDGPQTLKRYTRPRPSPQSPCSVFRAISLESPGGTIPLSGRRDGFFRNRYRSRTRHRTRQQYRTRGGTRPRVCKAVRLTPRGRGAQTARDRTSESAPSSLPITVARRDSSSLLTRQSTRFSFRREAMEGRIPGSSRREIPAV